MEEEELKEDEAEVPEAEEPVVDEAAPTGAGMQTAINTIAAALIHNELSPEDGYDAFDADEDGQVSLSDLLSAVTQLQLEISEGGCRSVFESLDAGKTGFIPRAAWLEAIAGANTQEILKSRGLTTTESNDTMPMETAAAPTAPTMSTLPAVPPADEPAGDAVSATNLPASQAPLSVQEMLNIVKAALSYNALSVEDGFHSFDADQDGRISLADLEAVCSNLQLGMSAADVQVLHSHLDQEKTSFVELGSWITLVGSADGETILMSRGVPAAPPQEREGDMQEREKRERNEAILKIQSLQRGRQTRQVLSKNDLEGARAIFAERHMMHDRNMDAKVLAREQGEGMEAQEIKRQDDTTAQAAHKIALEHKKEEDVAAVRMQSLYRGFRDRRQVRDTRENAEKVQREKIAEETRKAANEHQHAMDMQTSFAAGGMEKSYVTTVRKDGPARRNPGMSKPAAKAMLAPTLVDKKAIMTVVQKRACIVLEEMIKKWATSYARSLELAPGAEKTGALEFVAFFSKPSKEEPIAWPVVRVYLSMTNNLEPQLVPQVTYHLEGEKMKFDTCTDLGRRFKESWLDRIVMDKRAIRADMALRRKV